MKDDPFSVEADPYPPEAEPPAVGRRELLLGAVLLAPVVSGCLATRRLACAPRPSEPAGCQHRFCRYYRGPTAEGQ